MSVARVWSAGFAGVTLVVKASPRAAEARFYDSVAPWLRERGVPLPAVELIAQAADEHWIVMEHLPAYPEPGPGAWTPDRRMVAALALLHRETRGRDFYRFPVSKRFGGDSDATMAALSCFPPDARARLAGPLESMQAPAESLPGPWCWISGDASPPNWGARADGSLALFDWELFRPGLPASDLAPAVPGLAAPAAFQAMAGAYLEACARLRFEVPWSASELARDIVAAKAATVVMLLRAHVTGTARVPEEYVANLVATFPAWVDEMCETFGLG